MVAPEAPVGPVSDALAGLAKLLAAEGVMLVRVRRPWDDMLWPLATKGFFSLSAAQHRRSGSRGAAALIRFSPIDRQGELYIGVIAGKAGLYPSTCPQRSPPAIQTSWTLHVETRRVNLRSMPVYRWSFGFMRRARAVNIGEGFHHGVL